MLQVIEFREKDMVNKKMGRVLPLGIAILAFVFTSGFLISKMKVEPSAFGKSKRFAIVSIMSIDKISANQGQAGLFGSIKAMSKKYSFSAESDPVLKKAVPIIYKKMARSGHFTLVSPNRVLKSNAYRSAKGVKPKSFLGATMITAPGYKYFKSEKELAGLAKGLNVDAVVMVHAVYGVATAYVGPVGKNYGSVTLAISAVDRNGKVVWQHSVAEKDDKGRKIFGIGSADFKALEPGFYAATERAFDTEFENLSKKL
jgi:hypothetical protein